MAVITTFGSFKSNFPQLSISFTSVKPFSPFLMVVKKSVELSVSPFISFNNFSKVSVVLKLFSFCHLVFSSSVKAVFKVGAKVSNLAW
jgi:hypothetical protein